MLHTVICAMNLRDECFDLDDAAIAEQLVAQSQGSQFGASRISPINPVMVGACRGGLKGPEPGAFVTRA